MSKKVEKLIKVNDIIVAERFVLEEDKTALDNMVENLRVHELINAINVWQDSNGQYYLVSGYHRLTATKILGRETIRATVDTTKFKNNVEAYRKHRQENLHENGIRKHYTIYQLSKLFDELTHLHDLLNPDKKFAEEEYIRAKKREKMAKQALAIAKSKTEQEYHQREIEKSKKIQEETMSPKNRLLESHGITEGKYKQIEFINELDKKIPDFSKILTNSEVSEHRVCKLKRFFNDEDIINQFKKVTTARDMESLVNKLEGIKEASKINVSDVCDEGNGIVRLGTKHYICQSDTKHLVRKFDFNVEMTVYDMEEAKAALEVLKIKYVKALIVCTTDASHDLIVEAIKKGNK